MGIGTIFPPEAVTERDWKTGARVTRLTGYRGNSNHLYFTNNSFYANNTKIVFASERDNVANLFSLDLNTYEITQLTDLPPLPYPESHRFWEGVVDPIGEFCYFYVGQKLMRLNLSTLACTLLYAVTEGFVHHVVSCSADSKFVYTSIFEDVTRTLPPDPQSGTVSLRSIFLAKPLSKILKIDAHTGEVTVIREEQCFVAHVNASPTNPDWITFCHEGSWDLVDHRIWGMNTATGEVWKIRERKAPEEKIGHEYWYQDGLHIGYHGHSPRNDLKFMGKISFDGTEIVETAFPFNTGHIYSRDESLIVGDGGQEGKYIRLWKWNGTQYEAPRALCGHFSTLKGQSSHPHPVIAPDGKHVLFTSDFTGYDQLYLAEIPDDLNDLPLLDTLSSL